MLSHTQNKFLNSVRKSTHQKHVLKIIFEVKSHLRAYFYKPRLRLLFWHHPAGHLTTTISSKIKLYPHLNLSLSGFLCSLRGLILHTCSLVSFPYPDYTLLHHFSKFVSTVLSQINLLIGSRCLKHYTIHLLQSLCLSE